MRDVSYWNNNNSLRALMGGTEEENIVELQAISSILQELNLNNSTILDLGCGVGRVIPVFLQFNPLKIVGIDWSQNMINIAKEKYKNYNNVEFLCSRFDEINLLDNSFDLIFCMYVLIHLTDEEYYRKTILNMQRLTKKYILIGQCMDNIVFNINDDFVKIRSADELVKDFNLCRKVKLRLNYNYVQTSKDYPKTPISYLLLEKI